MIISVDHGNKSVKTPSELFTSGVIESDSKPGFRCDYIYWEGKYYFLTEKRISYLRDKTEDDRFYVLTLFAIARELRKAGIRNAVEPIDITLLVGLPPAHYGQLHGKFEQYFLRNRETVEFEFNDSVYTIRLKRVACYIQALAAAVTKFGELKKHAVSYVIDIGGFTIDILKLRYGKPDREVVESFEQGVITLYNKISSQCNARFDRLLEDADIDEVIKGETSILPDEVQQLIRNETAAFLTEFFHFLRERGIDTKTSKCVFAGGGTILVRKMIESSGKVGFPIFIDDIHANAVGYDLLYRSEVAAHGK